MQDVWASTLAPTATIEATAPSVVAFARRAVGASREPREQAVRLFYAVRDEIRYSPYAANLVFEDYRATVTLERGYGFCVAKAILLAAAARACGIPSRLGFADVRNHLATPRLLELMRTDIFVYHGYTELFLEEQGVGRWVKATPTFDRALCAKFGVLPLEFDGTADAIFHPADATGRRHMEYIRDHGSFVDLPRERLRAAWMETYPHFFTGAFDASAAAMPTGDFGREAEEACAAAESAPEPGTGADRDGR